MKLKLDAVSSVFHKVFSRNLHWSSVWHLMIEGCCVLHLNRAYSTCRKMRQKWNIHIWNVYRIYTRHKPSFGLWLWKRQEEIFKSDNIMRCLAKTLKKFVIALQGQWDPVSTLFTFPFPRGTQQIPGFNNLSICAVVPGWCFSLHVQLVSCAAMQNADF